MGGEIKMSKFLPYEVRQTIVRNGQFSVAMIDHCSTLDAAKLIACRSHNGNPTTHIHNVLTKEIWENRQGLWTSIGWDK
jgi:hypothetical protein